MRNPARLIVSLSLVVFLGAICRAGDAGRNSRETARFVAVGTARGMTVPTLVLGQHQKALANWKKLFAADTPESFESAHFLLFGSPSGKTLKEIAEGLEAQFTLAQETLGMDGEEIWTGKMAIYFFNERGSFTSFVRILEKRKAEEDEAGCFDIDSDNPHAIVGPSENPIELGITGLAGQQMAAALLAKKTLGAKVPFWVYEAFGRATVYRTMPAKDQTTEHRRAQVLLLKKKNLRHVVGTGLTQEDAMVLRASLVEYLAYSGRTAKFLPILQGFRPSEERPEPTFEAALMAANLSVERLDQVWQAWLKTVK